MDKIDKICKIYFCSQQCIQLIIMSGNRQIRQIEQTGIFFTPFVVLIDSPFVKHKLFEEDVKTKCEQVLFYPESFGLNHGQTTIFIIAEFLITNLPILYFLSIVIVVLSASFLFFAHFIVNLIFLIFCKII